VLVAAALAPAPSSHGETAGAAARPLPAAAVHAVASARTVAGPRSAQQEPDALSLARFEELTARRSEPAPSAPPVAEPPSEDVAVLTNEPVGEPMPVEPPAATSLAGELESYVVAEGLQDVVRVAVNGGGVTLSISDTIGFASGRAELLPDAAPVLAEVRGLVAARPDLVVEVAGHTDDRPVHGGPFPSNLELSLARAARVARELAAGDAVLATRVFAAGYGAERPVAPNDDAEGRARNRRVELRLVPGR
jgi:chemotaxis protein MotB